MGLGRLRLRRREKRLLLVESRPGISHQAWTKFRPFRPARVLDLRPLADPRVLAVARMFIPVSRRTPWSTSVRGRPGPRPDPSLSLSCRCCRSSRLPWRNRGEGPATGGGAPVQFEGEALSPASRAYPSDGFLTAAPIDGLSSRWCRQGNVDVGGETAST